MNGAGTLIQNTGGYPLSDAGNWLTVDGVSVPQVITVTSTAAGGPGSLPQAVLDANVNSGAAGTTIQFDPTVFATPQTITLSSTLVLSETSGPERIDGTGINVKISGGGDTLHPALGGGIRVFQVQTGVTATLTDLTISHGTAPDGDPNGGGIENSGSLTIDGCSVGGNLARGNGGGIYNSGTLTIVGSLIGNDASNDGGNFSDNGGGIYNSGILTVSDCFINNNNAGDAGGGIYSSGTLNVTESTIYANNICCSTPPGNGGGGIANTGTLTITNSSIVTNGLNGYPGAGGIDNFGTLTAVNTTFDNPLYAVANDLYDEPGAVTTLYNTIVASGIAGGPVSSASAYNLVEIGFGSSGGLVNGINGNLVGVDPRLGALGVKRRPGFHHGAAPRQPRHRRRQQRPGGRSDHRIALDHG